MQLFFLLVAGVPSPTPTPGTLKTLKIYEGAWGKAGENKRRELECYQSKYSQIQCHKSKHCPIVVLS